jgi:hypothetical protein
MDVAVRIAALESELAALKAQQQAEQDAALLHAIAASVGDYCFTAVELLEHAELDESLREALGPCVRPRQVGRRLARAATSHPLTLRCIGDSNRGCIWLIAKSP